MTLGRILVVDDDPWVQRSVASALGQRGYQVSLSGDAQGAFVVASKVRPDLIFTAVSLPAIEGWSWWERLRALPACADTPIVFLLSAFDSSNEVRGAGPRDLRLRKPFRVEDLERAIVTSLGVESMQTQVSHTPSPTSPSSPTRPASPALSAATTATAASAASAIKPSSGHRPLSAVRGQLDQIGLSSILVVLEMERKTGILLVERAQGTARLFLRKGRIIRADTEEPRQSGAAAVFEALSWTNGSFDFLSGDIGGVDEIQASTTFLLIEGARRFDEASEQRRLKREDLGKREENKL